MVISETGPAAAASGTGAQQVQDDGLVLRDGSTDVNYQVQSLPSPDDGQRFKISFAVSVDPTAIQNQLPAFNEAKKVFVHYPVEFQDPKNNFQLTTVWKEFELKAAGTTKDGKRRFEGSLPITVDGPAQITLDSNGVSFFVQSNLQ